MSGVFSTQHAQPVLEIVVARMARCSSKTSDHLNRIKASKPGPGITSSTGGRWPTLN